MEWIEEREPEPTPEELAELHERSERARMWLIEHSNGDRPFGMEW